MRVSVGLGQKCGRALQVISLSGNTFSNRATSITDPHAMSSQPRELHLALANSELSTVHIAFA